MPYLSNVTFTGMLFTDETTKLWKRIWASKSLSKWKLLVWKILVEALATKQNLSSRGMHIDTTCSLCHKEEEYMAHIFRDCEVTRKFWKCGNLRIRVEDDFTVSLLDWIKNWLHFFNSKDQREKLLLEEFLSHIWSIWIFRNQVLIQGMENDPAEFLKIHAKHWSDYLTNQGTKRRSLAYSKGGKRGEREESRRIQSAPGKYGQ